MDLPFQEIHLKDKKIRIFSDEASQEELNWHMDHEDRKVKIIECGDNWGIQFDNQLPQKIKSGDELFIPANFYHRVIKGNGKLIVQISHL